jgi:hypothetical protein
MEKENSMKHFTTFGLTAALAVSAAYGCAGVPTTSTQTAPAVQTADRHVAAVGDAKAVQNLIAQLPKNLTPAQADKMLVTLDPTKIKAPPAPGQATTAWAPGGLGYGGLGLGLGAYAAPGWAGNYLGYGSLVAAQARFRYLTLGSMLFPYEYNGYGWSPYSNGGYFNIFQAALGWYYPFNINADWCCQ